MLEQNNQLPYLDVLVTRADVKFEFMSSQACLLNRAYRICN